MIFNGRVGEKYMFKFFFIISHSKIYVKKLLYNDLQQFIDKKIEFWKKIILKNSQKQKISNNLLMQNACLNFLMIFYSKIYVKKILYNKL